MFRLPQNYKKAIKSGLQSTLLAGLMLMLGACQSPEERVANFTENGKSLMEAEKYELAGLEYRNALQIDPDHLPALIGLADAEIQRGNPVAAAGFLQRALTLAPDDFDLIVKAAKNLLRVGHFETLDELTRHALELRPESAEALALRGAFFMRLGQTEAAIEFAHKAIAVEPKNLEALLVLAAERVRAGKPDEAIAFIDKSMTGEASDAELMILKIDLFEQIGAFEKSEELFLQLMEMAPNNLSFRRGYALLLLKLGRGDEAEAIFRSIAAKSDNKLERQLDLVRAVNTLHGQQAAEKELAQQIANAPAYSELRFALVDLLLTRDGTSEAIQVLKDLALNAPDEKDRVRALSRMGRIYLTGRDFDQAKDIIRQILDRDPRNKDGLLLRAQVAINDRRLEDAIGDLRTILVDDPYSTDASLALGRAHELEGNLSLAETQYAQALRLSNANRIVAFTYRDFLLRQKQYARAEDVILSVLAQNSRDRLALRALAEIRLLRQNWIGAREVSDILEKLGEEEYITAQIDAAVLQAEDNLPMSVEVLQRAFENAPGEAKPLVSLVRAYMRSGRTDEAILLLEDLITKEGEAVQPVVLLAQLRAARGEYETADMLFNRAIEIGPNVLYPYRAAYIYYARQRNYKEARDVLERGLERTEDRANIELLLAELMQREGDFDGAIDLYERLYLDYPNIPVVANNLASLLTDFRGSEPEVLKRARQICERFKDSSVPQFKDTFGWVLYHLGEYREAETVLKSAADIGPDLAIIHFHLGMVQKELGDRAGAKLSFDRAMAIEQSRPSGLAGDIKKAMSSL